VCGSVVEIFEVERGGYTGNKCIPRAEEATTRKAVEMMVIYTPATKRKSNYFNIIANLLGESINTIENVLSYSIVKCNWSGNKYAYINVSAGH
jgi:hypothetical protein